MHNSHHSNGQPSFLFRAVCAIVFSTLLVETVASANTSSGTDPLSSLLQTISSLFGSAAGTSSPASAQFAASDSTGILAKDPINNPPPPPPPPPIE